MKFIRFLLWQNLVLTYVIKGLGPTYVNALLSLSGSIWNKCTEVEHHFKLHCHGIVDSHFSTSLDCWWVLTFGTEQDFHLHKTIRISSSLEECIGKLTPQCLKTTPIYTSLICIASVGNLHPTPVAHSFTPCHVCTRARTLNQPFCLTHRHRKVYGRKRVAKIVSSSTIKIKIYMIHVESLHSN